MTRQSLTVVARFLLLTVAIALLAACALLAVAQGLTVLGASVV